MTEIVTLETPGLGDRSYLAHDGAVALVVDPQRDIDRVLSVAADRNVTITHVAETHLHNDYVTGGFALARHTGATYLVSAAERVDFDRMPITDGQRVTIGTMRLTALAAPGHTFHHLAYALRAPDRAPAVFTGGSLLYGTTGRPDLLGSANTATLARAQYDTAHRLVAQLPSETEVYPTHGFGSFCSAGQTARTLSTLADEARENPVLRSDPASWTSELLAGLDDYPAYYARMSVRNARGPRAADLTPATPADATEIARRLASGECVVDLRHRRAFADEHALGALNIGLDGALATYLGWLVPWEAPITLVGSSERDIATAQRELSRIGVDRLAAAAHGPTSAWGARAGLVSYQVASFAELAATLHQRRVTVLDVRRDSEWRGLRLAGAEHIPLHHLPGRLDDVPSGEVWVHCASGYRAAIAASLLHAVGRKVVLVDGDLDEVRALDLPVTGANVVIH